MYYSLLNLDKREVEKLLIEEMDEFIEVEVKRNTINIGWTEKRVWIKETFLRYNKSYNVWGSKRATFNMDRFMYKK